jgi:hypothetical protein
LFIDGDQDDVSGYAQGVRKAFEGAVNSERRMLVYENARHNVGGNPPPPEAMGSFTARAFFDEPVWRKDRITAINQHFITAFLDLYLKGDETRRAYLDVAANRPRGMRSGRASSAAGRWGWRCTGTRRDRRRNERESAADERR